MLLLSVTLKKFKCNEGSYTEEKYQDHIPCSFADKIVCIDDNLLSQLLSIEVKIQLTNLSKQFFENINTAKK